MKCVLFDLDGTIADTEILKAQALAAAVRDFGGDVSYEFYMKWMGQSWEVVTSAFFSEGGVKIQLEELNPVFREHYGRLIDTVLVENRGSNRFLEFLRSKGYQVGLVSSASPWMIQKTLTKLQLDHSFDIVVSNADTERHKPHPDAYLIAMERLKVDSSQVIAFEDSESGFASASAAGIVVYGVKHSFNVHHDFSACAGTLMAFDECLKNPESFQL